MKTQEISAEKLHAIIEEKDRRITELENQIAWLMSQMRLCIRINRFKLKSLCLAEALEIRKIEQNRCYT